MLSVGFVVLIILVIIILILLVSCIKIVPQARAMVVERLGAYQATWNTGLHFKVPIIDRVARKVDLKEQVVDFAPQPVITKDNVTISINALLYFQIVDTKSAVYEISNLIDAIEKLTQTNLRQLVGKLDLDETLISRDQINQELREILDEATNKWGVKVNRVELQDINPPADIQAAMEKQMKAEREKRAVILESEGMKQAAILQAQGEKEAAINKAEGDKQAAILRADGIAKARVLEAEGEKQAVELIINAIGDKGKPDQYLIAMKYLETLKGIASGQNNKVVYMPYEATGVLSSVDGIKQMFDHK